MYLENTNITEIVILCKYSRQTGNVRQWSIQNTLSATHDCRQDNVFTTEDCRNTGHVLSTKPDRKGPFYQQVMNIAEACMSNNHV
jgi:hypothetical protein